MGEGPWVGGWVGGIFYLYTCVRVLYVSVGALELINGGGGSRGWVVGGLFYIYA